MTAIQAADALVNEMAHLSWVVSVGVGTPDGQETIYVYVRSLSHPELDRLKGGYRGFPVIIKKTGAIRPAVPTR